MRLAPKLGEIVLEPEPLPQARVEGEDHDGASTDDTPHLREGGSRVGEVVQGEYTDGALRATGGQRQPLSGRGRPTDTENLSSLPPDGRRRLDCDHAVAEASQGGGVVAGPGADVEDLTALRRPEQPGQLPDDPRVRPPVARVAFSYGLVGRGVHCCLRR